MMWPFLGLCMVITFISFEHGFVTLKGVCLIFPPKTSMALIQRDILLLRSVREVEIRSCEEKKREKLWIHDVRSHIGWREK